MRDVSLLVGDEVDIAWRGEIYDASHLLEGVRVDGKDNVRVIDHNPTYTIADNHRLTYIAEFHCISTKEHLVFHLLGRRIVVRERCIAVLEISLIADKQSL